MRTSPFDQSDYLEEKDRGVCIHLSIMWLANDGKKLSHMRTGRVRQAQGLYESGESMRNMLQEYFLSLQDLQDFGVDALDQALSYVLLPGHYVIGFNGADSGHAIGAIYRGSDGGEHAVFDPNEQYAWTANDVEYFTQLKYYMLDYACAQGLSEIIITRCSRLTQQGMNAFAKVLRANAAPKHAWKAGVIRR
jgi:hypothetical protein